MQEKKGLNELTRKAEEYLEAIFNITEEKGYSKMKDIASALEVSVPSVIEMVKKLDDMDFVIYRKYDSVKLTPKGETIGGIIKYRSDMIKAFSGMIKVVEKIADKNDAGGVTAHELNSNPFSKEKGFTEKGCATNF